MFSQDAYRFIFKLIRIQQRIRRAGYRREDQDVVNDCAKFLSTYLTYYKKLSDEKMKAFFQTNRARIRFLIPCRDYSGFKRLINEFNQLENECNANLYYETAEKISRHNKFN